MRRANKKPIVAQVARASSSTTEARRHGASATRTRGARERERAPKHERSEGGGRLTDRPTGGERPRERARDAPTRETRAIARAQPRPARGPAERALAPPVQPRDRRADAPPPPQRSRLLVMNEAAPAPAAMTHRRGRRRRPGAAAAESEGWRCCAPRTSGFRGARYSRQLVCARRTRASRRRVGGRQGAVPGQLQDGGGGGTGLRARPRAGGRRSEARGSIGCSAIADDGGAGVRGGGGSTAARSQDHGDGPPTARPDRRRRPPQAGVKARARPPTARSTALRAAAVAQRHLGAAASRRRRPPAARRSRAGSRCAPGWSLRRAPLPATSAPGACGTAPPRARCGPDSDAAPRGADVSSSAARREAAALRAGRVIAKRRGWKWPTPKRLQRSARRRRRHGSGGERTRTRWPTDGARLRVLGGRRDGADISAAAAAQPATSAREPLMKNHAGGVDVDLPAGFAASPEGTQVSSTE